MSDAVVNGLAGAGGGIIAQLLTYPLQAVSSNHPQLCCMPPLELITSRRLVCCHRLSTNSGNSSEAEVKENDRMVRISRKHDRIVTSNDMWEQL